jgi:hypothetical protein
LKKKNYYNIIVCFLLRILTTNTQFKTFVFTLLSVLPFLLYSQDKNTLLSDSIPSLSNNDLKATDNITSETKLFIANASLFYAKDNSLYVQDGTISINNSVNQELIKTVKISIKTVNSTVKHTQSQKQSNNSKPKVLVKSFPNNNNPFAPFNSYICAKAVVITITSNTGKELTSSPVFLRLSPYNTQLRYNLNLSTNKNLNYRENIVSPLSRFKNNIIARPPPAC